MGCWRAAAGEGGGGRSVWPLHQSQAPFRVSAPEPPALTQSLTRWRGASEVRGGSERGPGGGVSEMFAQTPPWLQSESEDKVLMNPAPLRGPRVQGGLLWPSGGTGQVDDLQSILT
ncbi:unnamed protein product [Arctogadus glacialis]